MTDNLPPARHNQFAPSPYGSQRTTDHPPPTYAAHNQAPIEMPMPPGGMGGSAVAAAHGYDGATHSQHQQEGYEASIPPSYHSRAVSPTADNTPQSLLPARRPVNGSWRDV
jgi:hypothetical protein